jgi:hypothetical protein
MNNSIDIFLECIYERKRKPDVGCPIIVQNMLNDFWHTVDNCTIQDATFPIESKPALRDLKQCFKEIGKKYALKSIPKIDLVGLMYAVCIGQIERHNANILKNMF